MDHPLFLPDLLNGTRPGPVTTRRQERTRPGSWIGSAWSGAVWRGPRHPVASAGVIRMADDPTTGSSFSEVLPGLRPFAPQQHRTARILDGQVQTCRRASPVGPAASARRDGRLGHAMRYVQNRRPERGVQAFSGRPADRIITGPASPSCVAAPPGSGPEAGRFPIRCPW